jgi:DNA-3-methyladenine glycosylase
MVKHRSRQIEAENEMISTTARSGTARKNAKPVQANRPPKIRRLRRSELPVDTAELARYLIGKTLVLDSPEGRMSGRIVETEAYPIGDEAGHAFHGLTQANKSLFLRRGHAYVRFTYGSCWLLNVSSENPGIGGGALIRGIEPIEGIELMKRHRNVPRFFDLTRGPGRLTAALMIDKRYDGVDLVDPKSKLWLGTAVRKPGTIGVSTRIGISRAVHFELRFYERGNPFVSGPGKLRL